MCDNTGFMHKIEIYAACVYIVTGFYTALSYVQRFMCGFVLHPHIINTARVYINCPAACLYINNNRVLYTTL